jgi:hypothetical protein
MLPPRLFSTLYINLMPHAATVRAVAWGMLVFVKEKKSYGISNYICPDRTG